MRKYLPILITLILVLAGCQSETNNTNTPEVGTPPSLQKITWQKIFIQLSDKEIEELHIETETVEVRFQI
jgi:uncharacterized protein YcfL